MGLFALCALLVLLSSSLARLCVADDRLLPGESLLGNQTIVSDGGTFALGFFALGVSTPPRRYMGIWYNNIPGRTVVWVANRETPFTDSSVKLHVSNDSNIVVTNSAGGVLWSSNTSIAPPTGGSMAAVLLDTGNLVLRAAVDDIRWQSFDYAGNTGLPGMKLRYNRSAGVANMYTSWKDAEDPSPGDFSFGIDPVTILQVILWKRRQPYWRYNPWNGYFMGGTTLINNIYASYFSIERTDDAATITFTSSLSLIQRFFLDNRGVISLLFWSNSSSQWMTLWTNADVKLCETYGACGPFGVCNKTAGTPACYCLKGYEPRDRPAWNRGNHSAGCARPRDLAGCDEKGGSFMTMGAMKLPDKMVYLKDLTSESDCEAACRSNCSCTAYSHANATNINITISRCYVWYGDLMDAVQYYTSTPGEDLRLRLPAGTQTGKRQKIIRRFILIPGIGVLLGIIVIYLLWRKRNTLKDLWKRRTGEGRVLYNSSSSKPFSRKDGGGGGDLPILSFECIVAVTNNFSDSNQLGEGGFGKVYKGILSTGEEIAIKRLSRGSSQGQEEFKNEVALIAKLQHKNLVKLLGSCIQGEERILVYEYLPNGSLNAFLFDSTRQVQLDWEKRFNIIRGIARGMMYLHHDSRFKIVHRDLKAGNILLDEDMNPKISDFGMARIFGGNESQAITNRVVGTYGYMSPEYAMEGHFSVKSDVYSFGVLLLEVVSGRRNSCFYHNGNFLNLLTYAWQMWKDDNLMEFADASLTKITSPSEVSRCVHVGLLCVQDHANKRPLMSSVVFMLENETPIQETPNRPMFIFESGLDRSNVQKDSMRPASVNNMSITILDGR